MDTLEKHNKEMEESFDEEFLVKSKCCNAEVRKLLSIKHKGLYCKICGRYCAEIEKSKENEIKSFITSQNTELLKKIAKGEIERLNELLKILDWHEPYRVCLEDQLTHWQQLLQDLER